MACKFLGHLLKPGTFFYGSQDGTPINKEKNAMIGLANVNDAKHGWECPYKGVSGLAGWMGGCELSPWNKQLTPKEAAERLNQWRQNHVPSTNQ